jgi:hypothetical protein
MTGFEERKGREVKGDELRGVPRENKYRVALLPEAPSSTGRVAGKTPLRTIHQHWAATTTSSGTLILRSHAVSKLGSAEISRACFISIAFVHTFCGEGGSCFVAVKKPADLPLGTKG